RHPDYVDGGQLRDFIYVKDVVRVIMQFVHRPDINGLFNLGTGAARSWNDLATAVCTALGKPPSITYIPMPDHLAGQYQNFTQADMTLLRSELPDLELTPLEDAVADYVNGYLHTPWPYLETTT
ncbi:MAG: ADP-L-glycero-D-mannoheptose-6-epimerase, partial [Candidatus Kapaibacteriota bacterium]